MANNAKHPQITLLLTRPRSGSEAFWADLPALDQARLEPVISPLIRIEPRSAEVPNIEGAIFTSANGPPCAPPGRGRIAYCVGARTQAAAQATGWAATIAGKTADELVSYLNATPPSVPLIHLSGTHTRGNIAERLSGAGIPVTAHTIYDQLTQPLNDAAQQALNRENSVILPLFSPRTAAHFAEIYQGRCALNVIALSDAVADQVAALGAKRLHICAEPTRASMVQAVQNVTGAITLG